MQEKHGIASDMMHGFNWEKSNSGKPTERLALIPAGQEHILEQEDGKKRWVQVVTELSRAFALCAASDDATETRGHGDAERRQTPNSKLQPTFNLQLAGWDHGTGGKAESGKGDHGTTGQRDH